MHRFSCCPPALGWRGSLSASSPVIASISCTEFLASADRTHQRARSLRPGAGRRTAVPAAAAAGERCLALPARGQPAGRNFCGSARIGLCACGHGAGECGGDASPAVGPALQARLRKRRPHPSASADRTHLLIGQSLLCVRSEPLMDERSACEKTAERFLAYSTVQMHGTFRTG